MKDEAKDYPPPTEPVPGHDAEGNAVLLSTEETDAGKVTHVTPAPEESAENAEAETDEDAETGKKSMTGTPGTTDSWEETFDEKPF